MVKEERNGRLVDAYEVIMLFGKKVLYIIAIVAACHA